MAGKIIRVTMFKIPSVEDQQKVIGLYKKLSTSQKKVRLPPPLPKISNSRFYYRLQTELTSETQDGKPYILSLEAGPLYDDARSNGYTFAAKSEFASKSDMDFYDTDCEAHSALKLSVKELKVDGIQTIYYNPAVTATL